MFFAYLTIIVLIATIAIFAAPVINPHNKITLLLVFPILIGFLAVTKGFLNSITYQFSTHDIIQKTNDLILQSPKALSNTDEVKHVAQKIYEALEIDQGFLEQSLVSISLTKVNLPSVVQEFSYKLASYNKHTYLIHVTDASFKRVQGLQLLQQLKSYQDSILIIYGLSLGIQYEQQSLNNFNTTFNVITCNLCDSLIQIYQELRLTILFVGDEPIVKKYFKHQNKFVRLIEIEADERIIPTTEILENKQKADH